MKSSLLKDKKKVLISTLLTVLVASSIGGGIYLSNKKKNDKSNQEQVETTNTNQNDQNDQNVTENVENKESSANNQTPTTSQPTTPSNSASADTLSDVSLQGMLNSANQSITVALYGGAGTYKIEKQVDGVWITVVSDASYLGSGGLSLSDNIPVSETQRKYRIFRTIGTQTSSAKEITVDRNLVVSNGIVSFPRAQ